MCIMLDFFENLQLSVENTKNTLNFELIPEKTQFLDLWAKHEEPLESCLEETDLIAMAPRCTPVRLP